MSTNPLIADAFVQFHDPTIVNDVEVSSLSENERFGLFTIQFEKTEITKMPIFILFTIDRTGSMSELGNPTDAYNKMHYVKETFKQIVEYIAKKNAEIYIKVHIFNTFVETLIDTVKITSRNQAKIVRKIMLVEPAGSTSIDWALRAASNAMLENKNNNPNQENYHIFMTDGEPTSGVTNHSELASMVNSKFNTVFIGFGKNHNAQLLRKLSEHPLANYEFIDNIEHTSIVYASIMHEILYTSIQNLRLVIENGEIYDWTSNSWVTEICEPTVVGESKKIYHVKTANYEDLNIKIFGVPCGNDLPGDSKEIHMDDIFVLPHLEDIETGETHITSNVDLSKYIYRQNVQEILFKSRSVRNTLQQFKASVSLFFRKMRRFMRRTGHLSDPLMIQLCDDICIVYRTAGTKYGQMFTFARESSQGRQQSNTVSMTIPDVDYIIPFPLLHGLSPIGQSSTIFSDTMNRIAPLVNPLDDYDDFTPITVDHNSYPGFETNDLIENHLPSETPISCFASPTAIKTIKSLTQSM